MNSTSQAIANKHKRKEDTISGSDNFIKAQRIAELNLISKSEPKSIPWLWLRSCFCPALAPEWLTEINCGRVCFTVNRVLQKNSSFAIEHPVQLTWLRQVEDSQVPVLSLFTVRALFCFTMTNNTCIYNLFINLSQSRNKRIRWIRVNLLLKIEVKAHTLLVPGVLCLRMRGVIISGPRGKGFLFQALQRINQL